MIQASPGATFESFLQGAPTGLAGTLTWRLIDPSDGSIETAASTAGITEVATGTYRKQGTAPTTADTYLVVWHNGSTEVTEELVVTSSAPGTPTPSGGDLTTLAAVRLMLQKDSADTAQDTIIQSVITRASVAIMHYAGREFAPQSTAARKFAYTGGGVLYFGSNDLQAATLVQIDTDLTGLTLTPATDYRLWPLEPPDGVYTSMLLPTQAASAATVREVTITGDWGFPSIPADVEEACILTVVERIKRDVSGYTQTFPDDESGAPQRPIGIPFAARQILNVYRRPMVA
jgi:hypothetical protein